MQLNNKIRQLHPYLNKLLFVKRLKMLGIYGRRSISLIGVLCILAACHRFGNSSTDTIVDNSPTRTSNTMTPNLPSETSPTTMPFQGYTTTIIPGSTELYSPILDSCVFASPIDLNFPGSIIIDWSSANGISLINSSNSIPILFKDDISPSPVNVSVSPFTGTIARLSSDNQWKFVTKTGNEYFIPNRHPYYYIEQWFPDDKVLLRIIEQSIDLYPAKDEFFVLDPLTDEEISYELQMEGYFTRDFTSSTKVFFPKYDPFLSQCVYIAAHENPLREEIVLWDLEKGSITWKLDKVGWLGFSTPIAWQMDGSHFATLQSTSEQGFPPEIVEVSNDGSYQILTKLSGESDSYKILDLQWSPNEKFLAFVLNKDITSPVESRFLYILNVKSGQITNYCLSPIDTIVWSPDSDYIAVRSNHTLWIIEISSGKSNVFFDVTNLFGWIP